MLILIRFKIKEDYIKASIAIFQIIAPSVAKLLSII